MAQVELELGVQRAVVGPLERGSVELDLPHILGDLSEAFGIEQRERLLPDLREGGRIAHGRVEEISEDLTRRPVGSRPPSSWPPRRRSRLDLRLLLILVDQVDEGLDQFVVDLPELARAKHSRYKRAVGTAIRCSL